MNRHEYKGYWIEIPLECRGEDGDALYYYCPSIEYPNEGGAEDLEDYVTYEEAKIAAEKHIDMLEASPANIFNYDEREDNDEPPDGDWSDPIL